ncbi:unnamed protein product [Brassica rapa subsp. trilocularis]
MLALPVDCPCTDFGQLMHHDAFGRDLCTCGLHFIGQSEILGGGSNLSDKGLNLSGSWQQGHSATYNTPSKGSIGHAFTVRIRTENQNQTSFYPFVPHEISVLVELILGHLRYLLTYVPPQPNSPPDNVLRPDRPAEASLGSKRRGCYPASDSRIGLESSSTGSSFPADSAKPVPLAVVSLDSRQGQWESLGFPLSVPVLSWLFDARGKLPKEPFPVRPPADTRRSALATLAAQAARQQSTGSVLGPRAQPSEPILFPKLRNHFADFPCLHCSIDQRLFTLET